MSDELTLQTPITLVTAFAEASDLMDDEYRAIYNQVAAKHGSLAKITAALQSGVSFGWWGKYANHEARLNRDRKNELRAWAGMTPLPLSVAEAVEASSHPDAAVVHIGKHAASRVYLIDDEVFERISIVSVNVYGDVALGAPVTPVTGPVVGDGRETGQLSIVAPKRARKPVYHVDLPVDMRARLAKLEALVAETRAKIAEGEGNADL